MKIAICFALLLLTVMVVPAFGQFIYSNGPINGTTDGWTINFGFVVSDTFPITAPGTTVTGLEFGAWLFPGDVLLNAQVSITSSEFGGTTYFNGVVNFTQSACSGNQYGYNVCAETGSFNGPSLASGTYWVDLQNAVVNDGDPIFWDENSGPSSASENSVGTVPSEAFSILGSCSDGQSGPGCGPPSVPEPGSIFLLASGMLGLAAIFRSKIGL